MTRNRLNINRTDADVSSLFRDRRGGVGYIDVTQGGPQGLSGDGEAPWIKTPPFPSDTKPYVDSLVIPVTAPAAPYTQLPGIECERFRFIEFYCVYVMAAGGQLSIIPEAFDGVNWSVPVVVGSTVTPIAPTDPRFAPGGFGSRTIFPMELQTAVLIAGTSRFAITFDVASYEAFRLNVIDLTANAGNTLSIRNALAQ